MKASGEYPIRHQHDLSKNLGPWRTVKSHQYLGGMRERLGPDSVESLEYLTRKERQKPFHQKDDAVIAAGGVSCWWSAGETDWLDGCFSHSGREKGLITFQCLLSHLIKVVRSLERNRPIGERLEVWGISFLGRF